MADEMGTVITIDNFTTSMSQFNPGNESNHLYGLVDMGSNGIRFSISDLSPPRSRLLDCAYRERAGISLYDALHESTPDSKAFHFSKHTIDDVARTLGRFKGICDGYGVRKEHISVFATEAMRTAKNSDEMLAAIKKSSGLTVDILSPGMESLFGAMGARSGFVSADGLFMDLGGGSVQMTYVNSSADAYEVLAAEVATSMPFGAAKLTQALSAQDTAEAAKTELRLSMRKTFEGLCQRFPRLKEQAESSDGVTIYFCGGGFRGYGSMLMHTDPIQPYPIPAIGGYTAPGHRFIKWREMLHANNYEEGKIHGMSKRRREQFPAIVAVVQSLVEAIPKVKEVTFCSGGNREGVLYMKLPAKTRELNPIRLLTGDLFYNNTETILNVVEFLEKLAFPKGYPKILSQELLVYIAEHIWEDMGNRDDANASRALHNPLSGELAGLPGMTHEMRAVLSLILCSRWGNDLGPIDQKVQTNLQALIGAELSWWCDYVGTFVRFLATTIPVFPPKPSTLYDVVHVKNCSTGHGLGRKGHKVGIKLEMSVSSKCGLSAGELEGIFGKVGKGLHLGWKVDADITLDD
ncbi:putative retrograde regulation protein 2 [Acephala macrosclerotiorum]|nr:putative retrograde regulation protein 2 [Acephala macrosclerotiorum]